MVTDVGVAPGAVVATGGFHAAAGKWRFATGAAGIRSAARPEAVDVDTPFDLASVTKPFVACTLARLVRGGVLRFETPLGELVPELAATPAGARSLELLAAHRAGSAAHGALYAPLLAGEPVDFRRALEVAATLQHEGAAGPVPADGFSPVYSDLGYLLLGVALERKTGLPLSEIVAREVTEPLGLSVAPAAALRAGDPGFLDRVAPTEHVPFRGGEICGAVHDENAWALSGLGLSGHAGLFGTAPDVGRFGAAIVDALHGRRPDFLLPAEAERLVRPRPGGTLRAGFDGRADEGSSAGTEFGKNAFGHLGFTGTSLWCDPDAEIVAVILTNRVNPTRENIEIRRVRPALNDALFRIALGARAGD